MAPLTAGPTMAGPVIETARLSLRPPVQEDFEDWALMAADEAVMQHLGGPQPRAVAWRSMAAIAGHWALRGFGMFSVRERAGGRWVGRIGPWQPEGWPGTEVGWTLVRDAQGRGYATEAASASIDWAIEALGWARIIHVIDPANTASVAVARRLGAANTGSVQLPPPHADKRADIWAQTAAQWRRRSRGPA